MREPRAFVGIIDLQADSTAMLQKRGFRERGGEVREGQPLEGDWIVEPTASASSIFPPRKLREEARSSSTSSS